MLSFLAASLRRHQGYLAGVQVGYDQTNNKLNGTNLAAGYQTAGFAVSASLLNTNEVTGSLYQKVNPKLETGVTLAWKSDANATKFNLGAVYKLDCCTSVRAKVNNSSQISLGFTHKLRQGVNLTLSALIEGQNLNQGGHKLGLGFEFEA
jgi:outer membrane usher protein FimD/PapC